MPITYTLTKEEKETSILYNQTNEPILIDGYDQKLFRKLSAFAEEYPDLCKRTDKGKYPDYFAFEIQKQCLSIRCNKPMSEEKKEAARERAKALGLGAKSE